MSTSGSRLIRFGASSISLIALATAGLAMSTTPAFANGGVGKHAGAVLGGAGGVDGTAAEAAGQNGQNVLDGQNGRGTGGGGGGVDITTGNGAPGGAGGSSDTSGTTVFGTPGATGAAGAVFTTETVVDTLIKGQTGFAGQAGVTNVNTPGGSGGGGVGVSTSANIVVGATGYIIGGQGLGKQYTGGGGGGAGLFSTAQVTIEAGGQVKGGAGGDLGSIVTSDGGNGGGGMGVLLRGAGTLNNAGTVTGGSGGSNPFGGGGGDGGAGVFIVDGGVVKNLAGGSIAGGIGGYGRRQTADPLIPPGHGGAGVKGSNVTLINAGSISGALSGQLSGAGQQNDTEVRVSSAAVEFTGGVNSLELQAGSVINGNVLAFSAADTLKLGGGTDASFDVSQIGDQAQYRGFGIYEKVGTSVWTLTGTTTAVTPWTLTGGTLSISADNNLGDAAGALTFNGGALQFTAAVTSARTATIKAPGGTVDTLANAVTLSGVIGGTGPLTKLGTGTLTLTGTNTYTGATTVSAGKLLVNGDQSAATGLTTVASGAILGGSGIVGGDVSIASGGTLAPGNSPGTLTINGDLSLVAGSLLNFELGAANVVGGPLNDLVVVGGDLVLDGTLNVATSAGGTFDVGVYCLFNYSGALTNNGVDFGTVPGGSDLYVQTSIANQVNLVNSAGLSLTIWDGAAGPKNDGVIQGGNGLWQNNAGNDNWTIIDGSLNAPWDNATFAVFTAGHGHCRQQSGRSHRIGHAICR